MQHRFFVLASMAGLFAAAFAPACSVDVVEAEETATLEQPLCTVANDMATYFVALATAEALELNTWYPSRNYRIVYDQNLGYNKVALSATAESYCVTVGNCPNVRSQLAMQDDRLWGYLPKTTTFNPTTVRQELIARIQRQKDHEADLRRNTPSALPRDFTLSLYRHTYGLASCGATIYPFLVKDSSGVAFTSAEAEKVFERVTKFYDLRRRDGGIPEFLSNGPVVGLEFADRTGETITVNGALDDALYAGRGLACKGTNVAGQPVSGTLQTAPRMFGYLYCMP